MTHSLASCNGNSFSLTELKNTTISGNFDESCWIRFTQWVEQIHNNNLNYQSKELLTKIREELKNTFSVESICGHILHKPLGYAGDYQLIEKLYNYELSADKKYKNWDLFIQSSPASQAVRNRSDYFSQLVYQTLTKKENIRILSLGSGGCGDIRNFVQKFGLAKIQQIVCVDIDKKAIEFSRSKLNNTDKIEFVNKNCFRYNSHEKFDLIWSAGLFDYFNDQLFGSLTDKYMKLLANEGELVIGNFSYKNTTKHAMDLFGWELIHRDKDQLIQIINNIKNSNYLAHVDTEAEGVNLFLRVKHSK